MKTLASRLAVLGCLVVLGAGGAVSESFDYIVVGGGTSGLVIANRLSENPQVTVAVIEAGNDESSNPLVTNPDNFANALNSYLDWNYTTTPQAGINGQSIAAAAGRALGGSSAINGTWIEELHYTKFAHPDCLKSRYDIHSCKPRRN